jgi:hypothetical protein
MNECYSYAGRGKFVKSLLVILRQALTQRCSLNTCYVKVLKCATEVPSVILIHIIFLEVQLGNQILQMGLSASPLNKQGVSASPIIRKGASASPINNAGNCSYNHHREFGNGRHNRVHIRIAEGVRSS